VEALLEISSWDAGILFTRWVLYIGLAASVGGVATLQLVKSDNQLRKPFILYSLIFAVIGLIAALSHFFVRVGAVLEEGAPGMFEPDMVSIMWESSVGDALLLRVVGFALFLMAVLLHLYTRSFLKTLMALFGVGLIACSFAKAGHGAEQSLLFQWLLTLHILLTAWWMGSLHPLWLICRRAEYIDAHLILHRFGQLAVGAVLVLICCGLFLSYQLTGWNNLFSSEYGILLLSKVVLVMVLLTLAAFHKLYLVPQLLDAKDSRLLAKSIMFEKLIGVTILGVTVIMTTSVGPGH
jgi:putative copper resistance protein D